MAVTQRWLGGLITACGWIGGVALLALLLHTVIHVLLRQFGIAMSSTLDMGGYWYMPAISFLGLIWTQIRREHIDAEFVYDLAPESVQRDMRVLSLLVLVSVSLAFAWFGLEEAIHNAEIRKASIIVGIPIWPAYFAVPLGFAAMALRAVLDIKDVLHPNDNATRTADDDGILT